MTLMDILALTPAEIQKYLDQRLAAAPPNVRAVVLKLDYVEPGSARDPKCKHYLRLGEYEGARDVIEIAIQIAPGAPELAVALILQAL